jgi:hypothetical protein
MTVIGSATYLDVGLAASSMLMHPELNKLEGCVTESGTFLVKGRDSRRESRFVYLKNISGLSG